MPTVGVEQVDGERGTNPDPQHLASLQRRQQGKETIHAQVPRIVVGDAQAGEARLGGNQMQSSEAPAQRI